MATKSRALQTFDRQFDRAEMRGVRNHARGKGAVLARYDDKSQRVIVELRSGVGIAIPVGLIQGLSDAPESSRRAVRVVGGGIGLNWPRLDVDINVPNLLAGVFGNRIWMSELARHAGSQTSPEKAMAARENGKKGGRPRKAPADCRARAS